MVPLDKVKDIIAKHDALEKELSSGNIESKLFAKKSKEYASLGDVITTAREYINFESEKKDLLNLLEDDLYKNNANRMKNRDSLNQIINEKMVLKSSNFWIKKLNDAGCPAAKIVSLPEALNSQLIKDSEMVISSNGPEGRKIKMTGFPVKLSETPSQLYRSPPLLGEHTEEVLKKLKK